MTAVVEVLDWPRIFELLACSLPAATLPVCCSCPVCRGKRLHVYEDSISRGTWHYCFDCKIAGDVVDLAAAAWRCGYEAAATKLVDAGVIRSRSIALDSRRDSRLAGAIDKRTHREASAVFWAKARRYFNLTPSSFVRRIMAGLHISLPTSPEKWLRGPGLMIGACRAKELKPFTMSHEEMRRHGPIYGRKNWTEAIIAPHYDRPGRICGFSIAGGRGASEDLFYGVPGHVGNFPVEAGIAGWETLEASNRILGNYILVVDCAFLAARLQAKHIDHASSPLPIVAYRDSPRERTVLGWECLDRRIPIFWSFGMPAAAVYHASRINGYISPMQTTSPSREQQEKFLAHYPPINHAHRAIRFAKPWKEALNEWSQSVSPVLVEDLLVRLESYGVLDPYLGISKVIDDILSPPLRPSMTVVLRLGTGRKVTILERDGQWFEVKAKEPPRLISNAIVIVHKAVKVKRQVGYAGTVLIGQHAASFFAPVGTLKLCSILQHSLVSSGFTDILYTEKPWDRRLLEIAILFRPPQGGR